MTNDRELVEVRRDLIRRLRDSGIAVILISHRMPDVFAELRPWRTRITVGMVCTLSGPGNSGRAWRPSAVASRCSVRCLGVLE